MSRKGVRIGGASGFWGDSSVAVPQLVRQGNVKYLVFDYLAELTMSILAKARIKNPEQGYAVDFVDTMKSMLPEISQSGIRVIANAGGVNPRGCAAALAAVAAELGIDTKIAVVVGDDVMPQIEGLRTENPSAAIPPRILSANAYLGALPIKRALDEGAAIVVTGRCVDSAVTLGALMHEFGWSETDYDKLAAGSLAGHIIECGCQATGGLHTDWRKVPRWSEIGYPIVEAYADGTFISTKPENTGGLVNSAVISEQILYEVGDPSRYILPDVVCDFTQVKLRQVGKDQVEVSGVMGLPPTTSYKVCATYPDGYRCFTTLTVVGYDAAEKAQKTGEAILGRTRALFKANGYADYTDTKIEILGAESGYGPHSRAAYAREVVLRLAVSHRERQALELFARELGPAGTSWAPGVTGVGGRPKVSPGINACSFLLPKTRLSPSVWIGDTELGVDIPPGTEAQGPGQSAGKDIPIMLDGDVESVPLVALAYGRSGDKGDTANIAIILRRPEYLPYVRSQVTAERVATYLSHLIRGKVTRYEAPGIHAFNFLCEEALAGGVAASLRNDPWGKTMAPLLLSMPVTVPRGLVITED
ncbi:acyclic terpene utilization AtuA family protein [Magnetospirillum sp. 15-1]|uniref:acyclic terpene utilization AtuA family protein n=1 Tax=Magnetospirillum sp. 15-1 TaxID=1979370 RepID=UPI000BBBF78B|nr:acyclic terpene utilization AtuA family protein [Magnetospirillum sp. 15-1]